MLPDRYAPHVTIGCLLLIALLLQVDLIETTKTLYHVMRHIAIIVMILLPNELV